MFILFVLYIKTYSGYFELELEETYIVKVNYIAHQFYDTFDVVMSLFISSLVSVGLHVRWNGMELYRELYDIPMILSCFQSALSLRFLEYFMNK